MSKGKNEPDGVLGRIFHRVQSAFRQREAGDSSSIQATATSDVSVSTSASPGSPKMSAGELINEGLRQRQQFGTRAAQPFFAKAAQLEPNSHVPWFMLGNVASELGDLDAAVDHYSRARDLQPRDHVIRYNLGLNLHWRGHIELAIEELRTACVLNPSYLQAQSSHIMALHNWDRVTPEQIDAVLRQWATHFAMEHPAAPTTTTRANNRAKLRVGFVSGDFRTHSVAHFFEPILFARDRASFEYILYSNFSEQDSVTERLRACADGWRDVWQLSDDMLIKLIDADQIDILVDLSGHTASNRLAVFSRRAAPVQITYLGYPASTGLATMDYRIADAVTDPPIPADDWHSERLLRMPDTQWCFRPFGSPVAPGPLPASTAGFVTFGSFNNLTKTSDTLLNCWAEILGRMPTARLRLTRVRSAQRAKEMAAFFESRGIAPDRIDYLPYAKDPPYGMQFKGVDIALDNYPYNGVTTTCESLCLGVPVVSLYGRNGVSRSGLSLLGAVGLTELAAPSPRQYVDAAVTLASDLARLAELRASLSVRFERSSLRDEKRFARNFEGLLRTAWESKSNRQPKGE